MTSALPLPQSTPLQDIHAPSCFGRSRSSSGSANSSGTVQHHRLRSLSGSSLSSLTSLWVSPFRRHDESTPSRSSSSHNLTLRRIPTSSDQRSSSATYSTRASFASILSSRLRSEPVLTSEQGEERLLDVTETDDEEESILNEDDQSFIEETQEEPVLEEEHNEPAAEKPFEDAPEPLEASPEFDPTEPSGLRRWLSTLRRRKQQTQQHKPTTPRFPRWQPDTFSSRATSPSRKVSSHHKPSSSHGSSLAFVTAMKSATATIASVSIGTGSRRNSQWRRGHQRSSIVSGSDPRPSVDSQRSIMDEATKARSRKRREKLEELMRTEENYIADMKALLNAYFTILGHQPTSASLVRTSAEKNISGILRLHEELLHQLHLVVPFAEFEHRVARPIHQSNTATSHFRWNSVDAVSRRATPMRSKLASIRQGRRSLNLSRSSEDEKMVLRCSPQVVAAVAKTFSEQMSRFALYEEYGANYELVQRDIDETQRAIASWPDFDKAIEALSVHVNPIKSREANRKNAMTIKDLLIKPIQRLPRYELLFGDLCKLTPVCDDPDSNATVQELLPQINWLCQRVNESQNDPVRSRMLEATWLLGERLTFSNQVPRSIYLQLLGQIHLCGCLHIAYRSKDRIRGSYVICVLFESTLVFASADDDSLKYSILAGIPLANAMIVESDNGKGIQCYTAPHSWKLVFEYAARMYEFILTACSGVEAGMWRQQTGNRIEAQALSVSEGVTNAFELQSPLISEMRSVGKAFGKPSSFVRRMSVHRTATVGPTTDLNQVIIKNTQAVKEALDTPSNTSLQIPRSQSVATPSHVQTLAPRRADRIRLEGLLSDVWTKDLLPYPGMQARRSDPIRASANNVIRKFSMASITSNFSSSKRSASFTNVGASKKEDIHPPKAKTTNRVRAYTKPTRPPLVNFHTAPEAFLPADFQIQDPNAQRKGSALRTLTMTMERPFSPLLGNDVKANGLRRSQSVKNVSEVAPLSLPDERQEERRCTPVYSVIQERPKTPGQLEPMQPRDEISPAREALGKTPAPGKGKSRNKLLRLFA